MKSGKCGKNLTWTLDDDGTLTISGRGKMDDCIEIKGDCIKIVFAKAPWDSSRESIKKVVIENGVTTIGAHAFDSCFCLNEIEIPESVESIGEAAFYDCTSLIQVKLPDKLKAVDAASFMFCESLTAINIPESVKSIGRNAFYECKSLTEIKLPDGLTSLDSRQIFRGCTSLTEIKIPYGVKKIGALIFNKCLRLEKIFYPAGAYFADELREGNNAELIPYTVKPPAQAKPSAETNCTVYRNTKISRAENIAPPDTKSLKLVDENIAAIRRAAELAAMNIVMTIERDLGFSPEDVSSQNLGYDIKSTSRDGKILRLIEVKGRHIDAETVTVSRNEIDAALNNPDNFILAIVRLDGGKNETIYIRQPFELPPDRAALSVNFSIQKLVEGSEIISG